MFTRIQKTLRNAALLAALAAATPLLAAEPKLASIFQDHMVLQREKPVAIWGWADAGTKVDVAFAGQKKEATADGKGYWKVMLEPLQASREGQTLEVKAGGKTLACKDVLVGEVWVIAGQSNMVVGGPDVDLGVYPHYVSPGTKGGKPEIRIIRYGAGAYLEPQADVTAAPRKEAGKWGVMPENPPAKAMNNPEYAARVIRDGLDVPVGLVHAAVSGTNQAAWMSKATLEKFPALKGSGNFYDEFMKEMEGRLAGSKEPYKTFQDFEKAQKEGKARETLPIDDFPTALYNTRIYPLAPLTVRGFMWHQGEAGPGGPYGERLVAMIKQWRELFGQDFYFIWGTLGRNTADQPPLTPMRSGFYRSSGNVGIRKAQELFGPTEKSKAALVEFYDAADNGTHWLAKNETGRRLGLAALTVAYGQKHVYTGPQMAETKIEGKKATVKFTHVGDGLVYEPSINGISGVYLRGKDGTTRWANVKVTGKDSIEVSHPDIKEIETVAYADNPNPHETIFNSAKLPASPFVVRPVQAKDPKGPISLVTVEGKGKPDLQVPHVRRSGYVFKVGKAEQVQAFIPKEWNGYEVESAGKPIETKETTQDGAKLVKFEAPAGTWVIVAEKGKASEFRNVNRI
jgi:sialate O-acetylesterase